MMKQKIFVVTLACLGVATTFAAGGGDSKASASRQNQSTASRPKGKLLSDTTQSPENAQTPLNSKSPISSLFEASSGTSAGVKLNPHAVSFVQDYMQNNGKDLLKIKDWGRPYFNMIDGVFKKHGLPVELKYLAVIESKLKAKAVSWVGAVGPWQFMPGTARELGLKVTHKVDERTNYYKSTQAAARYLKDLYGEFGDWLLVIAAYNGGPGNVYSAIKRSGSRNFWALQRYLPNETRNHVKKFIGTHYIFEGQGGITTLTKTETASQIAAVSQLLSTSNLSAAEMANARSLKVSGKYHSEVIAKHVLMETDEFHRYNPNFDKVMATADNSYELKLPADKMELFVSNKYQILNESVQLLLTSTASADPTSAGTK